MKKFQDYTSYEIVEACHGMKFKDLDGCCELVILDQKPTSETDFYFNYSPKDELIQNREWRVLNDSIFPLSLIELEKRLDEYYSKKPIYSQPRLDLIDD